MWQANERVLAKPTSEMFWYPGTIRYAEDSRCYVILDNQEDGWFAREQLRSLEIEVGSQVIVRGVDSLESRHVTVERLERNGPWVRNDNGDTFVAEWASIQVPANPSALQPPHRKDWNVGDRVFARWGGDLLWYPGTVFAQQDLGFLIVFDDQDKAIVPTSDIAPLSVEVDDRVLCRPKFEPELKYFPAEITRVDGEVIDVRYEDPDTEEHNTNVSRIRIRRETGAQIFWEEGDRVLASGRDEFWFPALVLALDGERTFVSLLDGRHGWLKPEEIRSLKITPGMSVQCRKGAASEYLPAIVESIHGNVVQVKYDDGTQEVSLLSLLRMPNG